jgi:hypothetical protein
MPLFHFLLVYDHKREALVGDPRQFKNADEAASAYAELEREHRDDPNVEIVLVGADSIETIKRTHGNYFNGAKPVASPYLTGV